MVLYKYYPPERVDVLERRMIYFAHPSAFNDPFELQAYSVTFGSPGLPPPPAALVVHDPTSAPSVVTSAAALIQYMRQETIRDEVRERHKHTLVFSTSEDGEHVLLWSYYAAGHTGFAVGFDASKESFHRSLDGLPRRLQPVNYSYLRPAVQAVDELREQELLLTKSSAWQHEREWRMFESPFNSDEDAPVLPDLDVWGFRLEPSSVERVVLGARILGKTRRRIVAVLNKPEFQHVQLLEAYLSDDKFLIKHRLINR